MKDIGHFKHLVESIERKGLQEDWGSSDWYPVIKHIDDSIEKYGLSPETIADACNEMADFYHDSMGYESAEDAYDSVKNAWLRMSDTGQQLAKMFAPVEEMREDEQPGSVDYTFEYESYQMEDGEYDLALTIHGAGHEIAFLEPNQVKKMIWKYRSAQKGRM